jgi:hypothetical protein
MCTYVHSQAALEVENRTRLAEGVRVRVEDRWGHPAGGSGGVTVEER